jgi:protein-disulfide isomerase
MREALFSKQQALSPDDIAEYVKDLGLDSAAFASCFTGNATKKAVADQQAEGMRLGVTATPTFFVGQVENDGAIRLAKRIVGAQSAEQFRSAIASVDTRRVHIH